MITEHITNANNKVKQVKGKNTPDFIVVRNPPTSSPAPRQYPCTDFYKPISKLQPSISKALRNPPISESGVNSLDLRDTRSP